MLLILFENISLGISQEQNRFLSRETSFCQLSNLASSGLMKMLNLNNIQHKMVSQCWCVLYFVDTSDIFDQF